MTPAQWRNAIGAITVSVLVVALFPGLTYRIRWSSRLGPRGLIAYVAFRTAAGFALRELFTRAKRAAEQQEAAAAELRQQMGRDPTEDELIEHLYGTG